MVYSLMKNACLATLILLLQQHTSVVGMQTSSSTDWRQHDCTGPAALLRWMCTATGIDPEVDRSQAGIRNTTDANNAIKLAAEYIQSVSDTEHEIRPALLTNVANRAKAQTKVALNLISELHKFCLKTTHKNATTVGEAKTRIFEAEVLINLHQDCKKLYMSDQLISLLENAKDKAEGVINSVNKKGTSPVTISESSQLTSHATGSSLISQSEINQPTNKSAFQVQATIAQYSSTVTPFSPKSPTPKASRLAQTHTPETSSCPSTQTPQNSLTSATPEAYSSQLSTQQSYVAAQFQGQPTHNPESSAFAQTYYSDEQGTNPFASTTPPTKPLNQSSSSSVQQKQLAIPQTPSASALKQQPMSQSQTMVKELLQETLPLQNAHQTLVPSQEHELIKAFEENLYENNEGESD